MSRSIAPANGIFATQASGGDARRITPVLYLLGLLAAALSFAAWLRTHYSRHIVNGESMEPTLREGDWILVDHRSFDRRLPRPGEVVLAEDPREPSRRLVKRVARIDLHGDIWLLGDNPTRSTDSRIFGPVPRESVTGRVRLRYWPAPARM